jgi:3-phosphoglycerate kinase
MKSGVNSSSRKSRFEEQSKSGNQQTSRKNDKDILATRQIIDSSKIKKSLPIIKYLIENLASRTFIIGNLSDKSGKVKPKNTMRFVWNSIASKIDQPVLFQESYS